MNQYLLIPFLVGWTSIYQLFWCSPGVQGFDTLPYMVTLGAILMGSMLPYIAAPWIRHGKLEISPVEDCAGPTSNCVQDKTLVDSLRKPWRSGRRSLHLNTPTNMIKLQITHRIHGAAIYANIKGIYWWDPWHTIYSSTMDPMGLRYHGIRHNHFQGTFYGGYLNIEAKGRGTCGQALWWSSRSDEELAWITRYCKHHGSGTDVTMETLW